MRPVISILILFASLLPFAANAGIEAHATSLSVGIVPQQTASRLARLWVPLLRAWGRRAGLRLRFHTAPDIPTFEKRLAEGRYDVAYMNPYDYTVFSQSPGYRAFAHEAHARLTGILVVRRDSPVKTLRDLQGMPLALPAPMAFAASLVTRAELARQGIRTEAHFVGSHDSVYYAVAQGLFPAGGGVPRTLNGLEPKVRDALRVLWKSRGFTPHAFAAHPRVNAELVTRLKDALLSLGDQASDRPLLDGVNMQGFMSAEDVTWDDVRGLGIPRLERPARP